MKKRQKDTQPSAPSNPPYEVGYRRPPKHSRFTPGKSGNPKGRRKGRQNFATIVAKLAQENITVTEGGRRRRISRYSALQQVMWARALKGDIKAFMAIQQSMRDAGLLCGEPEAPPPVMTEDDRVIVENYLRRFAVKLDLAASTKIKETRRREKRKRQEDR